jgi:sarcosine oxidase subunit alpha
MGARFTEGAGWEVPALFSMAEAEINTARTHVGLADVSDRGKILVAGKTAGTILSLTDSLEVGQGVVQGGRSIFCLRPDQFFVTTTAELTDSTTAELTDAAEKSADLITVTDLSHGRSQLLLIGPKAAELLGRLCGLDFHDSRFPNQTAQQSSVAKTRQLILRQDNGTIPAYALIGSRSLAAYLWQTTLEAGRDLQILPIGQASLDSVS